MAKVSIVIPCFNSGEFLDEAITSALNQTYKDLEVIVVDDGSTEPFTLSLINGGFWERTKILRQENRGPAAARNAGIRAANGEYILPLDADDKIDHYYIEKALPVLLDRPEVGVVYCKAQLFGKQKGPWLLPSYSLREIVIDNVIFCSALFRKKDWEKVNGFTEDLAHGVEDYDFWIKLISSGLEVIQLDEYLFYYRVRENSRTTQFHKKQADVVKTYSKIFRNNINFFADHADILFENRFWLYSEIERLKKELSKYEELFNRIPFARQIGKYLVNFLRLSDNY